MKFCMPENWEPTASGLAETPLNFHQSTLPFISVLEITHISKNFLDGSIDRDIQFIGNHFILLVKTPDNLVVR
jgi:hypothetical protein